MRFFYKAIKLLTLLGLTFLVFSCNDENERVKPERYLIRLVFDDSVIEFDDEGSLGATKSAVNGQYLTTIYGGQDETIGLTIQVFSNSAITTGTYSGFSQGEEIAQGVKFTFVYEFDNFLTDTDNPIGSLTISELTDSTIRGTFSAALIQQSPEETITLSQGVFYVEIID